MYYLIGNPTNDIIIKNDKEIKSIGGSVVYASLFIKNMGNNVGIIGKSDKKIKQFLTKYGIETTYLYNSLKTTIFKNYYVKNKRIQYAIKGEKLNIREIPYNLINSNSIYLAPVLNEIPLPYNFSNVNFLMVDLSGFLRKISKTGEIILSKNYKIFDILRNCHIAKCNLDEARFITDKSDVYDIFKKLYNNNTNIFIITADVEGAYICDGKKIFKIPAYQTLETDPTGSGDIFGSSFLVKYLECYDIIEAGIFASSSSSYIIEDFGIRNIPNRNKIMVRTKYMKNLVKKHNL